MMSEPAAPNRRCSSDRKDEICEFGLRIGGIKSVVFPFGLQVFKIDLRSMDDDARDGYDTRVRLGVLSEHRRFFRPLPQLFSIDL